METALNHNSANEEELVVLQDILDECINGRLAGHACPFCGHKPLDVNLDEGHLRIECSGCKKFFEGRFT